MKGLRVAKNVKTITFKKFPGELKSRKIPETITHKIFQTNSNFIARKEKSLISVFQEFSANIKETFILAGRLGIRLSFYEVQTLS